MREGYWFEIEGPDGSGKDTQAEMLAPVLAEITGRAVVLTHEPWEEGSRGQLIRDVLTHKILELPDGSGSIDPTVFQWQYVYNRAFEHYPRIIEPALSKGEIVIGCRGRMSTYAYGNAFGVSPQMVHEWHELCAPEKPDKFIYLATSTATCMSRLGAANREGEPEYFERTDKIARIVASYEEMIKEFFPNTIMVDNHCDISEVHDAIVRAVVATIEGR